MTPHYLGEKQGVTLARLQELGYELAEIARKKVTAKCECELIQICLDLAKTREELAVIAYIIGKKEANDEAKEEGSLDDALKMGSSVKN